MEFGRCSKCGEYQFSPSLCSCQKFLVWLGDDWGMTEDDGMGIFASDGEKAAEEFCNRYDSGGDYPIIQSGHAEVFVKDKEGNVIKFEVDAYSVPTYHASKIVDTSPKKC